MKSSSFEKAREHEFGDLQGRFQRAIHLTIVGGADHYDRQRHLPRLLGAGFENQNQEETGQTLEIVRRLSRAIRQERQLGRRGHHAYDLNRHIGLRQALRAELASLRKLKDRQAQLARA